MKLVVLGSGTSVPHPQRASAAFWLATNSGSALLDISGDAPHRMAEEHLDWAALDAIWVSHFHLDHMGGLSNFLFGTKWAPNTQARQKPLNIFGPTGLSGVFTKANSAHDYRLLEQPFPVKLIEVQPGESFSLLPNLNAQTFSTPHTTESLSIRVTDKGGRSLVYSSDTGYSAEFAEFCRDTSLLLMECSFLRNKPVETHLELSEALKIARDCAPEKLVLTHLYPEWDDVDMQTEVERLKPAEWPAVQVIEARDGLRIEV